MSGLTIPSVPDELRRRLEEEAVRRGLPLDRAVICLLEERVGLIPAENDARTNTDFDEFFGTWPREEALEFEEWLRAHRQIDEELWRD